MKGVTSLGLRAVLDFVYTSRLALNSNHIHDILQTASHLQFNQVIDYCCQFLKYEAFFDDMVICGAAEVLIPCSKVSVLRGWKAEKCGRGGSSETRDLNFHIRFFNK